MNEILQPCPFCGSKNINIFPSFGEPTTNKTFVNVQCLTCGAATSYRIGEKAAAAAWNKRVSGTSNLNSELLALVSQLSLADNYPRCKEIRDKARVLLKRYKEAKS